MNICIYGASSDKLDDVYCEAAKETGRVIAEAGHTLIYGGGRGGLMGKCAHSAFSNGGHIIGIAPGFFDIPGVLMKSCGEFILTDTMRERKYLMEEKADAFVLLPGGIGSFEEFFETLTLKQLGKLDKPIVVLNTAGYYEPMFAMLKNAADQGFMGSDVMGLFKVCDRPEEIIGKINEKDPQPEGYHRRLADYNK